jgi:hypothetical protein
MKTIKIPSSLHEVFGEESTLAELSMILTVSLASTLALFYTAHGEWSTLPNWKIATLFLLIFDVMAGFIANLTLSTNNFYRDRPKTRLVFIALHVQPLLFAFLLGGHFTICLAVWIYTIIAALIVNANQKYAAQKAFAGSLVAVGLVGLQLASNTLPLLLLVSLTFYQLKVAYSFAVDHYAPREI